MNLNGGPTSGWRPTGDRDDKSSSEENLMEETNINQGLEGVTVIETRLSHSDGEAGELIIGGVPIEELAASAIYEERVFLLFQDRFPTADELSQFQSDLTSRREICDEVQEFQRGRTMMSLPTPGCSLRMTDSQGTQQSVVWRPRDKQDCTICNTDMLAVYNKSESPRVVV